MVKAKRKEREFNLRRAEILEQAEKIFAAKGFHNTTVAEIAGASGFAVGTLYQFFESKEQLYIVDAHRKAGHDVLRYSGVGGRRDGYRQEDRSAGRFSIRFRREQCGILQHLHPGGSSFPLRGKRRAPEADEGRLRHPRLFHRRGDARGDPGRTPQEDGSADDGRRPDGHRQFLCLQMAGHDGGDVFEGAMSRLSSTFFWKGSGKMRTKLWCLWRSDMSSWLSYRLPASVLRRRSSP